jgi:hypothetical protein
MGLRSVVDPSDDFLEVGVREDELRKEKAEKDKGKRREPQEQVLEDEHEFFSGDQRGAMMADSVVQQKLLQEERDQQRRVALRRERERERKELDEELVKYGLEKAVYKDDEAKHAAIESKQKQMQE